MYMKGIGQFFVDNSYSSSHLITIEPEYMFQGVNVMKAAGFIVLLVNNRHSINFSQVWEAEISYFVWII